MGYLGVNDWRLPAVTDTGAFGCDYASSGTDCGYNVDLSASEMARIFYSTLGNIGYRDTNGVETGCATFPSYCVTNTGPFANLQPDFYWSGTSYALPSTIYAWGFLFSEGVQDTNFLDDESEQYFAWAVHSGDIVPVPGAVRLFGAALTLLGVVGRRATTALV